jgi:hypothetical protein
MGGRTRKKKKVRKLIRKEGVEVMAIQESKLGAVDKTLCAQLWDGDG